MVSNSWLHRCNWCIINNYTQLNKSTVLIPSLTYVATWIALKEYLVFWALAIASSCYLASRPVSSLASWLHMLTSPHTHTYLHPMPQWKTLLHTHMMITKQTTSDRFVPKHTLRPPAQLWSPNPIAACTEKWNSCPLLNLSKSRHQWLHMFEKQYIFGRSLFTGTCLSASNESINQFRKDYISHAGGRHE